MRFKTSQHLRLNQQMRLAPRIILTMEILQLSLPALEEKLAQELESNIALELLEPEAIEESTTDDEKDDEESEFSRLEEFEEQSGADLSDLPPRKPKPIDGRDPKLDAMANIRARQESLSELLMHQWSFAEVEDDIGSLGKQLIGLIDADGLLTLTNQELLQHIASDTKETITNEQLDDTVTELQKWLDPPGMAGRSLQESLLIQVVDLMANDSDGWADVKLLIESHLDGLVENKLPSIATASGIGLERVKAAMEKMHELTMSPGRLLATDSVLPVIPDAFIEFDDQLNRYIVTICDGSLPALRISSSYESIVRAKNTDEQSKHFIQRNINAARWLIDAVGQRRMTLLNVVQVVVDRQRDFLDQGDAFLRPLPMVEVADMLGIHVATVSRAVADKWIQTPRGIFPLRRFFSGGTGSRTDGEMSWEAVKTRLQEIVDQEDKKKPFSDEALATKLKEQGIEIARRTVVKYRQQLSIPAARLRKSY